MAHEQLNTDTRSFEVKFKDGSVITDTVLWIGAMDYDVREDGGPSTLFHPFDDLRCSWNISGAIMRQVSITVGGQSYVKPDLTAVFNAATQNVGSSFVLSQLRSENCNDCRPRRESDLQNMRAGVNAKLVEIIPADLAAV